MSVSLNAGSSEMSRLVVPSKTVATFWGGRRAHLTDDGLVRLSRGRLSISLPPFIVRHTIVSMRTNQKLGINESRLCSN